MAKKTGTQSFMTIVTKHNIVTHAGSAWEKTHCDGTIESIVYCAMRYGKTLYACYDDKRKIYTANNNHNRREDTVVCFPNGEVCAYSQADSLESVL
jgi:hypothetical protein